MATRSLISAGAGRLGRSNPGTVGRGTDSGIRANATKDMSIIQLTSLTRRYGQRVGVEDLTLTVGEGTLFGFLGPNGAGKTTTIRVLLGLLKPTAGSASVFGLDAHGAGHRIKRDLGYLPGDLRLYPWLTLDRALRIFGAARKRDLDPKGQELAETFELDREVPVRRMSRGMKQKLGLILALAHQPRLLILDEPTTALDPIMQERLYTVPMERPCSSPAIPSARWNAFVTTWPSSAAVAWSLTKPSTIYEPAPNGPSRSSGRTRIARGRQSRHGSSNSTGARGGRGALR